MPQPKKIIDIYPPKKRPFTFFIPETPKDSDKKEASVLIEKKHKKPFLKIFIFILLFLLAVAIFSQAVFSRVEIQIWPETEDLSLEEKISVDTALEQPDFLAKIIPGKVFENEETASQQFTSSGKVENKEYATGTIRIYNNYHLAQTLKATTRFQPPLEKVLYFRSQSKVVVPAKGFADVEVKADMPGEDYNIGPSTFSLPGLSGLPQYYSIYGKSSSAMKGGFKGQSSQVSSDDLVQAQAVLMEKINKNNQEVLAKKIPQDYVFFPDSVFQEVTGTSSVSSGVLADKFDYELKVKSKAIVFKKADLDEFVKQLISIKIQDNDKKLDNNSLKVDYSVESFNNESGKIILSLKITAKLYSDIDTRELKKSLFDKSLNEARLLIENLPNIKKVQIQAFPVWLRTIPEETKIRIKLNID